MARLSPRAAASREQPLRLGLPESRRTASGVGDQGDVSTRLGVTVEDPCREEKHVPRRKGRNSRTGLDMRAVGCAAGVPPAEPASDTDTTGE